MSATAMAHPALPVLFSHAGKGSCPELQSPDDSYCYQTCTSKRITFPPLLSFSLLSKHIRGLFLQLLEMIMGDMCPFPRMHACRHTHVCTHTCARTHMCAHTCTFTHVRTHAHSHTHMSVSCPPCHRRGHSWEQGRLCPHPRHCTFQCVTKGAQCVFWVPSWLVPWPGPRDGTHPESHYWALLERGVFLQKIIKTFLGKTGR